MKDRNFHPSCDIYKREYTCGEMNVGETVRNVKIHWAEHNKINKKAIYKAIYKATCKSNHGC